MINDLKCPHCKSDNWWEIRCERNPINAIHMNKKCNIHTNHHHYHCGDCLKEWINSKRIWQIGQERKMKELERKIENA